MQVNAALMGKKDRQGWIGEDSLRRSSQDEFVEPGMAIGTHYQHVGIDLLGVGREEIGNAAILERAEFHDGFDLVSCEIFL